MREHWLDEHVGDEAAVRPEFEAELADALHERWHAPEHPRELKFGRGGRSRAGLVAVWASVAAAALVVGVIALTSDDAKPHVTGSTSDLPESSAPESSAPESSAPLSSLPLSPVPSSLPATTSVPLTVDEPGSSVPGDGHQISLPVAHTPEQQTVLDYLVALAESRWDDAAQLLGEGGLELEARADLRPLTGTDGALNDLPTALRDWCASPAMCIVPTSLATSGYDVVATFTVDGVTRSSLFVGGTFEGSPLVHGLPLRLPPPGTSLADTVPCPVDDVVSTVYADLDSDGWDEVVTLTRPSDSDPVTVSECGTLFEVEPFVGSRPFALEAPRGLFVLPGAALGEAADRLLLTHEFPDGYTGEVLAVVDGSLLETGQAVGQSANEATSFGCADIDGDGVGELVNYTYRYVGGTDLSNSTSLHYEATEVLPEDGPGGATSSGSLSLPAQQQQAFEIIAGYCGNLPVQTG